MDVLMAPIRCGSISCLHGSFNETIISYEPQKWVYLQAWVQDTTNLQKEGYKDMSIYVHKKKVNLIL